MENSIDFINKKLPFKTNRESEIINGQHTDIILTKYADRVFVIITQYEKMGTMVLVKKDVSSDEQRSAVYSTQVLFGQDEPEITATARNFMENLDSSIPIIFSLALKDYSFSMIREIANILHNKFKQFI